MNHIAARLCESFVSFDARVLAATQEWALARATELREFQASDERKALGRNQYRLYAKLFEIAGGKTWYALLNNSNARIEQLVIKHCAVAAAKRNLAIEKKLVKAGVTDITGESVVFSSDGFNGLYEVATPTGACHVKIATIVAGGHNIQCLHLRVLVTVI